MPDLAHDDPVFGPCIVTFDGRILELFTERGVSDRRMIVGMLHVDVGEPNRKGRREIGFTAAPRNRGNGFKLWADAEQWAGIEPFVREVAAFAEAATAG